MNGKKLIKKLRLSQADFDAIKKAVQDAEVKTNGEIAVATIPESSDYSFYELFYAVILGAFAFAAMLSLHQPIRNFLDHLFWHMSDWYIPAFYGIVSFAAIGVFFLLANIPAIDRLIIPGSARRKAVYSRALRHFTESGVYATKDRTGILIFISYMEREVRIVADAGISAKIAQTEWDVIARDIATGIKTGKVAEAITEAVTTCGELLTAHFPAKKENPNELADGLVVLEVHT